MTSHLLSPVLQMCVLIWMPVGRSQEQVIKSFVGRDVLLPCVYKNLGPQDIYWRADNGDVVLDIIIDKPSYTSHFKFKDRVISFPDKYASGNFSIVLKNVRQEDSGTYKCHNSKDIGTEMVQLEVLAQEQGQETKTGSEAEAVRACFLHLFVVLVISQLSCC